MPRKNVVGRPQKAGFKAYKVHCLMIFKINNLSPPLEMPSLAFGNESEDARPVARVRGGQHDGEILYLSEDSTGGRRPSVAFNRTHYAKELLHLKPLERKKAFVDIETALKDDDDSELSGDVKALYTRVKKDIENNKLIELDDEGLFELLPPADSKKRSVWYVAGQSGSGKSWIAKQIVSMYHKLNPSRGVYLVSKLEQDDTLDSLKFLKRVPIKSFVDDYPTLDEMKDSCLIFDDWDTLTGDAEKVIHKLIEDISIMGRHSNTTILILSHYLTNFRKTRLILNEATHIVVYPLSTSYYALKYLLKNYVGVEEDELKKHRKLGSRWLCYTKGYPQIMISQKHACVLHQ